MKEFDIFYKALMYTMYTERVDTKAFINYMKDRWNLFTPNEQMKIYRCICSYLKVRSIRLQSDKHWEDFIKMLDDIDLSLT